MLISKVIINRFAMTLSYPIQASEEEKQQEATADFEEEQTFFDR